MASRMARAVLLMSMLMLFTITGTQQGLAQTGQRCFEETGYCIAGAIRTYWEQQGGLAVFGYPITEQREETIEGTTLPVQWFERDRLEDHGAQGVMAGRLGADVLAQRGTPWQSYPRVESADAGCTFFPETGHSVCEPFLSYWQQQGGLQRFGYPITQAIEETIGDWTGTVQYFERRRMEHHPQNDPPYDVLLGLLGKEMNPTATTAPQTGSGGSGSTVPAGWQEFTPPDGSFSVLMPGTPQEDRSTSQSGSGQIETVSFLIEASSGSVAYAVSYTDFPPDFLASIDNRELLNLAVEQQMQQRDFTIMGQHDITMDGHAGVEFTATGTIEGLASTAKSRVYMVNNRFYMLICVAANEYYSEADANRFLESFTLLP